MTSGQLFVIAQPDGRKAIVQDLIAPVHFGAFFRLRHGRFDRTHCGGSAAGWSGWSRTHRAIGVVFGDIGTSPLYTLQDD